MTKNEAIESILNRIEEIIEESEFEYVGIRVQEDEFVKSEILDNSYVWIDGEPTDEELDGTCAVMLKDAELAKGYFGDHIAIIGGNNMEYGEDLGEIIIKNAEVMEVIA
nr:MAG TPA: hypothetical protein [Caudoviricetes sp.]